MRHALKWSACAFALAFVRVAAGTAYGAAIPLPADARAVYIDAGPHNDRPSDLMVLDQSGKKTKLTSDSMIRYSPVFSPDGSKIAFGVTMQPVNGELDADARIVVVNLQGKVMNDLLVNKGYPLVRSGSGTADSIRWAGNNKLILEMPFNPDESIATIIDLRTNDSQSWVDGASSISPAIDGEHWALINGVQHFHSVQQSEAVMVDGCFVDDLMDKRPFMVVSPLAWSLNTSGTRQLSMVIRQGPKTALTYTLVTLGFSPDFKCDERENTDPATRNGEQFKYIRLGNVSVDKFSLRVPADQALDESWNVFYSPNSGAGSMGDLAVLEGSDDAHQVAAQAAFVGKGGRTTSLTAASEDELIDPANSVDRLQGTFDDFLASHGLRSADADVWSASIALAPRANPYSRQTTTVPDDTFP